MKAVQRHTFSVVAVLVICTLLLLSSRASAFGHKPDVRTRIGQQIEKSLKAIKASKKLRIDVLQASEDLFRLADDLFGGAHGLLPETDEVLALFASNQLDERVLENIKSRRDKRHHRVAEAVENFFFKVHKLLDKVQREKLAMHARNQVSGPRMVVFKEKIIDSVVRAQVADLLDQLVATPDERNAATHARDEVLTALKSAHENRSTSLNELATLFSSDVPDANAITAFRIAQEERLHEIGELFARVLRELHMKMSPEHRARLVALMRDRKPRPAETSDDPM